MKAHMFSPLILIVSLKPEEAKELLPQHAEDIKTYDPFEVDLLFDAHGNAIVLTAIELHNKYFDPPASFEKDEIQIDTSQFWKQLLNAEEESRRLVVNKQSARYEFIPDGFTLTTFTEIGDATDWARLLNELWGVNNEPA